MKKLTLKMIQKWEIEAGECFIDYHEHLVNGVTLSAFMAGHRKMIAPLVWEAMNEAIIRKSGYSIQETLEIYEELWNTEDSYLGRDLFFKDFIIAVNTTTKTKDVLLKKLLEKREED